MITLPYHPRPSTQARTRRRAVILAIALLTSAAGIYLCPALWPTIRLLRWQYRCDNYHLPADRVVLKVDSPNAKGQGDQRAKEWRNMCRGGRATGDGTTATAFLHGRTTPRGTKRIVEIECRSPAHVDEDYGYAFLEAFLVRPGTIIRNPVFIMNAAERNIRCFPFGRTLRVFSGQDDNVDPSHFSFQIEIDGVPEMIDGWLNDNDTILLEQRTGPVARKGSGLSEVPWVLPHPRQSMSEK